MSSVRPVQRRNKWTIDFTTRPKALADKPKVDLPAPVGFTDQRSLPSQDSHDVDHKLIAKKSVATSSYNAWKSILELVADMILMRITVVERSWNIALGPIKQLPMNLFIMYMAGNSVSIFPIMMVGMMIFKPIKAVLTIQPTFKMLNGDQAILQRIIYLLGNIMCLGLALYKCHSMGLLPTAPSDWLAFKEHRQDHSEFQNLLRKLFNSYRVKVYSYERVEYIVGGVMF